MSPKPLAPDAEIGRMFSHNPNTRISTIEETSSGITVAARPKTERIRSNGLP